MSEPVPPVSSHPPSRWDHLVAVGFVLVLMLPGLALVAGVRPPALENQADAGLPRLDLGALSEPKTYKAIDDYVARRLPGRDVALGAYAALDYGVLRGSTDPDVVVGRGDWLFFVGELAPTCPVNAAALMTQLDTLAVQAKQTGVKVRFAIAPDKHAIYPEQVLNDPPRSQACTDAMRAEVRAGMAARPQIAVDLWAAVLAERTRTDQPLYYNQDSHWTPTGAMPAIEALVDALAPGVWDPAEVTIDGKSRYPMELARLMGQPRDGITPRYVVRPTVTVAETVLPLPVSIHLGSARDIKIHTTSGSTEIVPGTTLVVYDSFLNINRRRIVPWFERTIWVHGDDLRAHPEIAQYLPPIDSIVLVRAERGAYLTDIAELLRPVLDRQP